MALGAVVILRAAVRDRAQLRWLVGAGGHPGSGLGILWVLPIATVLAVLLTQRTLGPNYLLPLYGVLPIWTGECLWWLWCRRRWVGGSLMAALLAFHLWANWAVTLGSSTGRGASAACSFPRAPARAGRRTSRWTARRTARSGSRSSRGPGQGPSTGRARSSSGTAGPSGR